MICEGYDRYGPAMYDRGYGPNNNNRFNGRDPVSNHERYIVLGVRTRPQMAKLVHFSCFIFMQLEVMSRRFLFLYS